MDLNYLPEDEAFRTKVRTWLRANIADARNVPRHPFDALEHSRAWQRRL